MRNALLFLFVLAMASPAPAGRTETILQQSDDSIDNYENLNNRGIAQWFEAPVDCHIVSASFFYRIQGTKDVGIWDNAAGSPDLPGTLLGSVSYEFPNSNWTWSDYIELTGLGVTIYAGDKFWVGIDYSSGYPHIGLDNTDPDHGFAYTLGSDWSWYPTYDIMVRVIIDDDMDPPYVDGQDPADGGWTQDVGTDIVFHCKDDDKGIDSGTIGFSADDGTKTDISGTLYIDDDPNDVVCTFTPDSDLPEGAITCTVAGTLADGLGNEMGADAVWSFSVDGTPPTITQEYPTGGRTGGGTITKVGSSGVVSMKSGSAVTGVSPEKQELRTGVDPSTNIGWHIEYNAAGCFFADCVYSVRVGGNDVPLTDYVSSDGTTDVVVLLDPDSDFNPGDVVDVWVQATDIAGNMMEVPYQWSFTVGYVSVEERSLGEIKAGYH